MYITNKNHPWVATYQFVTHSRQTLLSLPFASLALRYFFCFLKYLSMIMCFCFCLFEIVVQLFFVLCVFMFFVCVCVCVCGWRIQYIPCVAFVFVFIFLFWCVVVCFVFLFVFVFMIVDIKFWYTLHTTKRCHTMKMSIVFVCFGLIYVCLEKKKYKYFNPRYFLIFC